MNAAQHSPKPLTGRRRVAAAVGFFGVVIGVNLTMMRLAIQTLPGTEVDSAYSASLAYENEIVAAHAQNLRNWHVDAQIQRSSEGRAMLRVRGAGQRRPADVRLEVSGPLRAPDRPPRRSGGGVGGNRNRYLQRNCGADPSGQWDLVLKADRADQRMFLSQQSRCY